MLRSFIFPQGRAVRGRAAVLVAAAGVALLGAVPVAGHATAAGASPPARIVAAGGAVTEILYELGLGDAVVGVDTTSLFPAEARKKPNVGYVRSLSAEGVLSLQPDAVIAIEGAGPPDALKLVEQAGVHVDRVPDTPTEEGVLDRIRKVGKFAGKPDEAEALAGKVGTNFQALARQREAIGRPARALFVMSLQNGRPLVAGRGTGADGIIRLAGAVNAAEGFDGYKPMTEEAVVAAAPDVIVMMTRDGQPLTPDQIFSNAALAATPAGEKKRLVAMEGLYLLGFGPRTPQAATDLMQAIYTPSTSPAAAAQSTAR